MDKQAINGASSIPFTVIYGDIFYPKINNAQVTISITFTKLAPEVAKNETVAAPVETATTKNETASNSTSSNSTASNNDTKSTEDMSAEEIMAAKKSAAAA